ncbi:MAG: hypothetical protein PHN56_04645 [Candidatus Nanoarchaeia archaeon]|nr:hypothetical protein [Candidatus Nanoarchaeia archaeon]
MQEEALVYFTNKLNESNKRISETNLCLFLSAYEMDSKENLLEHFSHFERIRKTVESFIDNYVSNNLAVIVSEKPYEDNFKYFTLTEEGNNYLNKIVSSIKPEEIKIFDDTIANYYERQAMAHSMHARVDRRRMSNGD